MWESETLTYEPPVHPDGEWFTVDVEDDMADAPLESGNRVLALELLESFTVRVGMDEDFGYDSNCFSYCGGMSGWNSFPDHEPNPTPGTLMIRATAYYFE